MGKNKNKDKKTYLGGPYSDVLVLSGLSLEELDKEIERLTIESAKLDD